MPRVPSVGLSPTSRPQFQAPGVVSFQGTGELQQSARDIQRLGQIGSFVSAVGQEAEDKINDARAMEAVNSFENGVNKALLAYEQTKGRAGVDGLESFNKQVEELRNGSTGMLMNDSQRNAATPLFDKVSSRVGLRAQSHYLSQSAADKQAQSIARRKLKEDTLGTMDLTVNQEISRIVGSDEPIMGAVINPQAVVEFGQFNNLLMQEGEALGLTGSALEVFMVNERDKLFTGIVNRKLDTKNQDQIEQVKSLIRDLPDGVISETQRVVLHQKILDESDVAIASQDIIEAYSNGDTLQDVYAHADSLRQHGVYTDKEWEKYRDQAASYYRQQREAEAQVEEELLDEAQSLTDQGLPVPSGLADRAAQLGIKSSFDKIIDGADDWLPEGRSVWADYEMNPAKALADYQSDPKGFIARLDGMMPWASVQQIIRSAKDLETAQSSGRGRRSGSGASSSINLVTERELANGLLQQYAYGFGQKHGLSVYKDNPNLSDYQKANMERRWREALQPLVEFEMSRDPSLSTEDAVNKVAPKLWASGQYENPDDGKPRNKWSEAAYHISGYASRLENEVDDQGRKLVDVVREDLQREAADKALERRMARESQRFIPPTPALLGFPEAEAMRSTGEIRQQVMAEMQANQEMFGVAIPSDDTPLYVSQQEVYDGVEQRIQDRKDRAAAQEEGGRSNREQVAVQRLDAMMEGDAFQQILASNRAIGSGESLANEWSNFWGGIWGGNDFVPLPTKSPNQMSLALEASKTLTVTENGKPVNAFENFIQNGGTEKEWNELIGHHAISGNFLEADDAAPSRIPGGRMRAGGRGGTTYAERVALYNYKPPKDPLDVLKRNLRRIPSSMQKVERQAAKIKNDIERYENTPGYEKYVQGKRDALFKIMQRLGEYESNLAKLPGQIEELERKREEGK